MSENLTIKNDGKEKSQSWEAFQDFRAISDLYFVTANVIAWGETETEAREQHRLAIEALIRELEETRR